MSASVVGPLGWGSTTDKEGQREYWVSYLVRVTSALDGPAVARTASGLPWVGSMWLVDNDVDVWAFRTPQMEVAQYRAQEGDPHRYFSVKCYYSSRPQRRCQDTNVEDPLLEPQKVSGSFVQVPEEAAADRYGYAIRNNAFERIVGPTVTFDDPHPTVHVEQNVISLQLGEVTSILLSPLNDAPLWGLPARCVKLTGFSWERLIYGQCHYYYKRTFDFEVDFDTFDRDIPSYGQKCLRGYWDGGVYVMDIDVDMGLPDSALNPQNFVRYQDVNGNCTSCYHDSMGMPIVDVEDVSKIHVERYEESNLLLLGIPIIL